MITIPENFVLPYRVRKEISTRWREPHRKYHGMGHLHDGLNAIDFLGGSRIEKLAYQFHDIVHSCSTPKDEIASSELAGKLLEGHLDIEQIVEVQRLIMLTAHDVAPALDDQPGRRIRDADLSSLAADWKTFMFNNKGIREEQPAMSDAEWARKQNCFIDNMLGRERIFLTEAGFDAWEDKSRNNLKSLQEHFSKWVLRRGRTLTTTSV